MRKRMTRIDTNRRDWDRFYALRKDLHNALNRAIEMGEPGKSWEGEMAVTVFFPGVYDEWDEPVVRIHADVYLIGPNRHYDWTGDTFSEALDRAESDIRGWLRGERGESA